MAFYFATKETLAEFEGHVTINCTPQRAFEFLKDPSNLMKIHPLMTDVQIVEFRNQEDGVEFKNILVHETMNLPFGYTCVSYRVHELR